MSVEELRQGAPERDSGAEPGSPYALDAPAPPADHWTRGTAAGRRAFWLLAAVLLGALLGASLDSRFIDSRLGEPPLELTLGPGTLAASPANAVATLVVENRGSVPVEVLGLAGEAAGLRVRDAFVRPIELTPGAAARMAVRLSPRCARLDRGGPASVRVTARTVGGEAEELALVVGGPGASWDQAFVGLCGSVARYVVEADYLGPFLLPGVSEDPERPTFRWLMRVRLPADHTEVVSISELRLPSSGDRAGTEPVLPKAVGPGRLDLLVRAGLPGCQEWLRDGTDNGLQASLTTSSGGRETVFLSLGADFERDLSAAIAASCPRIAPAEIALRHI